MEKFVEIPGFERYKISNLGYVISCKGKTPKKLVISSYPNGYKFVSLSKDGIVKGYLLHRLVMMSFCPCEGMENLQVNHIDCDKNNNCLDNLEWVTPKENRDYREKMKHTPKAETILVHFLDESKEDMVFDSMTACAQYFGITRKAINRYLETDNVRSDRKVQAVFRRLGKTSELN